jgi:murein DD-endopeptidase MepM/ murein hydrolase activator NlpD
MTTGLYSLNFSLEQPVALIRRRKGLVSVACIVGLTLGMSQWEAIAVPMPADCPARPALARLRKHKVQPHETLTQIANRYRLVSATLMGTNPTVRNGKVIPGQTLVIPPYNGIVVSLAKDQTIQSIARAYKVRPDVLFEINGCQSSPKIAFVPGINWSPVNASPTAATIVPTQSAAQFDPLLRQDHSPLPQPAILSRAYGWQPTGANNAIVFSSGVNLATASGTPVYAVADGTVAFAGVQNALGKVVVINHARGRQTRYGYLGVLKVKVGQPVVRGQVIATVGTTAASALRFELRYRSSVGWVAQDPQPYLQAISGIKK